MRFACTVLVMSLLFLPATAVAKSVYGLEFTTGLLGEVERDADNADADTHDLATTWGISPWMEFPLAEGAGIGPEANFVWFKRADAADSDERRLVFSPHVRLRMSFPLGDKVSFDGFLSLGPSWWMSTKKAESDPVDDHRFGYSYRFGFGGSYTLNRKVVAFMHFGRQSATSFGSAMTYTIDAVPIGIGLRASY